MSTTRPIDALGSTDIRWHLDWLPTHRHDAALRMLKVSLPTLRVWLTTARRGLPLAVFERLVAGAWVEVTHEATTEAERGQLRAYVRSRGLAGDPRVASVRWDIFEHRMRVTLADGREVSV